MHIRTCLAALLVWLATGAAAAAPAATPPKETIPPDAARREELVQDLLRLNRDWRALRPPTPAALERCARGERLEGLPWIVRRRLGDIAAAADEADRGAIQDEVRAMLLRIALLRPLEEKRVRRLLTGARVEFLPGIVESRLRPPPQVGGRSFL